MQKKGVLKKVLFILDLRSNLFSIGLASKAGLSFQTLGDKCVLYQDLGKGPKFMEGTQIGTLYKLSINPVPPTSTKCDQFTEQIPSATLAVTSDCDADLIIWHNRKKLNPSDPCEFYILQEGYFSHLHGLLLRLTDGKACPFWSLSLTSMRLPKDLLLFDTQVHRALR